MRRHYRAAALAILLSATPLAFAQSATPSGSKDFTGRGGPTESFIRPLDRNHLGQGALDNTGIGGPNQQRASQITPVPEPSQWAMMLAGLVLVGFIVRRNLRTPRDPA